jgi:hypothetical protein
MAKLDELIEELRNDGREEDAGELEKLRGSELRKKAEKAAALEKERDELKQKLEKVEKTPKVRDAFAKAGVDLDSLSKLERKAIESYDGDLDEDAIGDFIEENELPVASGDGSEQQGGEEEPAAKKVAQAARRSGEGRGGHTAPAITPDDAAAWSADRWAAFHDEHPEEAELLLAGKNVVGMTS